MGYDVGFGLTAWRLGSLRLDIPVFSFHRILRSLNAVLSAFDGINKAYAFTYT